MSSERSRVSYPALLLAVFVFIAANAHLETSSAADARRFTVASVPNVHLADKTHYVSDPDKLLQKEAVAAINRDAADLEARLGVELAVVALKNVGENDAREFATDLFNHWGLGKKGKDNGLLILLVTEPPERSVIFETGYGLEGVLPDAIAFRLQQRYMVPDFKNNDWSKGLAGGVKAVRDYLAAAPEERALLAPPTAEERRDEVSPLTVALIIFVFLALAFWAWRDPTSFAYFLSSVFSGRGGGGRRGGGGWGGGGWGGGGGSWGGGSSGGGGARSRF